MDQAKFEVGQLVKFINDHDRMAGKILDIEWSKVKGYVYKIASKYYDVEKHDMIAGVKICLENELKDMTGYTGTTDPVKPDKTVEIKDQIKPGENETPAQ